MRETKSWGKWIQLAAFALAVILLVVAYLVQNESFGPLTYEQRRVRDYILSDTGETPLRIVEWFPPERIDPQSNSRQPISAEHANWLKPASTAVHVRFELQPNWPSDEEAPISVRSWVNSKDRAKLKPGEWLPVERVILVYDNGTFYDCEWPLFK